MDVVHAQRYLTKSFPIISKVPVTPFDKRILFETVNFPLVPFSFLLSSLSSPFRFPMKSISFQEKLNIKQ